MKDTYNKYKINSEIVKEYVESINSVNIPMNEIINNLKDFDLINDNKNKLGSIVVDAVSKVYPSINKMSDAINDLSDLFPREQMNICKNVIMQIVEENNNIISTRMIEPLQISRAYISMLEQEDSLRKISRGLYQSYGATLDEFYAFQQKYKKTVFSHMSSLCLHFFVEENEIEKFDVTVLQKYHVDSLNANCNVFYVSDDLYELGVIFFKTKDNNEIKTYDVERSICDIIRSENRMDSKLVDRILNDYKNYKKKNIDNLINYSNIMGIEKKVKERLGDIFF